MSKWMQVLLCVAVALLVGDGLMRERTFNHKHSEVRAARSVYVTDLAKRDSGREAQTVADIASCSLSTDAIRCQQAFRCLQSPEHCVFEHGDASAVVNEFHDRNFTDLAEDREIETRFTP